jgi:hypothetical protein
MPGSKISPLNPSVQSELNLEGEIERRAYELYIQRGQKDGHALDDWLSAEEELRANGMRTGTANISKAVRVA